MQCCLQARSASAPVSERSINLSGPMSAADSAAQQRYLWSSSVSCHSVNLSQRSDLVVDGLSFAVTNHQHVKHVCMLQRIIAIANLATSTVLVTLKGCESSDRSEHRCSAVAQGAPYSYSHRPNNNTPIML